MFKHDAPDPGVVRAADGTYYAYTTQSVYDELLEVPILASKDLVHWRLMGDALPHPPPWVIGGAAGDVWAPHVLRLRNRYLLYYAGRQASDGSMAIGVAVASSPLGPFRDLGGPLLTRSKGQPTYTAIDPFVLHAHRRLYLYWGSDNQPIRVTRLTADGVHLAGSKRGTVVVNVVPPQGSYGGLVEGAWVLPHDHMYYLFYSVGDCCSDQPNYSLAVSRSRHPMGPFSADPNNPVLAGNAHFSAPGHNATVTDADGGDWLIYHARVRDSFSYDRDLMLDRITWSHGWPTVNDGRGPSWTPQPAPAVRRPVQQGSD